MNFTDAIWLELLKFAGAIVLLLLAWLVGQRLTVKWSLYQKEKENDSLTARDFHLLYGEFFAVWKLWNYFVRDIGANGLPGMSRASLLDRASIAEGKLEAILVRIASSKDLNDEEVKVLGRFRQIYQSLRETIRDGAPLEWNHAEHPDYIAFKRLAPQINAIIIGRRQSTRESRILEITSNKWER
jgi:hypothetical protein